MNEYLNFQLGHHPETFMQVKADSPEGTEESSSLPVSISIYLCGRVGGGTFYRMSKESSR